MAEDDSPVDLLGIETSSSSTGAEDPATLNLPVVWVFVSVVAVTVAWLLGSSGVGPSSQAGTAINQPAVGLGLEHAGQAIGADLTTTTGRQTTTTPAPLPDLEPLDPESPLSLIVSNDDRLQVISFATGEVEQFEKRDDLVGVFDDYLILRGSEVYQVVPLSDLEAEPRSTPLTSWVDVIEAGRPNHVWGLEPTDNDNPLVGNVVLVDLTTGQIRERLDDAFDPETFGTTGWPTLITGVGGGVYEQGANGYQRRTEGRLHAADTRFALVETCDETYRCVSQWLDRSNWQPDRERHAPRGGTFSQGKIVGNGRVLLYSSGPAAASLTALDIATGVHLDIPDLYVSAFASVAVGPAGKWIAYNDYNRYRITIQPIDGGSPVHITSIAEPGGLVIAELP